MSKLYTFDYLDNFTAGYFIIYNKYTVTQHKKITYQTFSFALCLLGFLGQKCKSQSWVDFCIFKHFFFYNNKDFFLFSVVSYVLISYFNRLSLLIYSPRTLAQEMRYPRHLGAVTKDICFLAAGENEAKSPVNTSTSPLH